MQHACQSSAARSKCPARLHQQLLAWPSPQNVQRSISMTWQQLGLTAMACAGRLLGSQHFAHLRRRCGLPDGPRTEPRRLLQPPTPLGG